MDTERPRATRRGAVVDWVKFDAALARDGSVDPVDKALYAAIASFVDLATRETPEVFSLDPNDLPDWVPTRKRLAECIGKSVDTVDRSLKRLETRGLLRVHRQPDPKNPKRMLPSEYELLDHHVWDERAAQRAAARAARNAADPTGTPGRTDAATPSDEPTPLAAPVPPPPGRTGAAVKDIREVEEEREETAPSARSAASVRSTGSGSSARGESGSAATDTGTSTTNKGNGPGIPAQRRGSDPKLTRKQAATVRAVEAKLPPALVALLPYGHIPTRNRPAVLAALESRTVEQIGERITRRWTAYGYEPALHAGEIGSPVGAALELIAPTPHCPNAGCEDGELIDTGAECRACVERRAARRAARLRGEPLPDWTGGTAEHPECDDCGRPMPGRTDGGLCQRCDVDPEAAVAALAARLAAEKAEAQRREELHAEAAQRRQERARREAAAQTRGTGDQSPEDAAEMARIREQVMREHPELLPYAQASPQSGPPPF